MGNNKIAYVREPNLSKDGENYELLIGRPDFMIEDKIVLDLKAKKFITKDDYVQMQKYLALTGKELGLIVNFRASFIKPKRVLNHKLHSEHSDVN